MSKIKLSKKRRKEIEILSKFNEFTLKKKICILKALKSGVDITVYGDSYTPIDVMNILFKYKNEEDQRTVNLIIDQCNKRGYDYDYLTKDVFNSAQLNILYLSITAYDIDPSDFAISIFSAKRMNMYMLLLAYSIDISDIVSEIYTDKYIEAIHTIHKFKDKEEYDISKEKNYVDTYDEIVDHIRTLECPF